MQKQKKKKWVRPMLVVFRRDFAANSVLQVCKQGAETYPNPSSAGPGSTHCRWQGFGTCAGNAFDCPVCTVGCDIPAGVNEVCSNFSSGTYLCMCQSGGTGS
jgi:hypothetical protein